jgi:hypothetical protein
MCFKNKIREGFIFVAWPFFISQRELFLPSTELFSFSQPPAQFCPGSIRKQIVILNKFIERISVVDIRERWGRREREREREARE